MFKKVSGIQTNLSLQDYQKKKKRRKETKKETKKERKKERKKENKRQERKGSFMKATFDATLLACRIPKDVYSCQQ